MHDGIFLFQNVFPTLSLTGNRLTSVPNVVPELANLTSLNLSGNRLCCLDSLFPLQNLTFLDARDNNITSIRPELFSSLSQLVILCLSENRLRSLDGKIIMKVLISMKKKYASGYPNHSQAFLNNQSCIFIQVWRHLKSWPGWTSATIGSKKCLVRSTFHGYGPCLFQETLLCLIPRYGRLLVGQSHPVRKRKVEPITTQGLKRFCSQLPILPIMWVVFLH